MNSNYNYDYIFDICIDNNNVEINLSFNHKLGEGTYGKVYFFIYNNKKYAIKIFKELSDCFLSEIHFYNKYFSIKDNLCSVPIFYNNTTIKNKIDDMIYNAILIEYVGFFDMKKFIKKIRINNNNFNEINKLLEIIYNTGIIFLKEFHKNGLVCRDIKPENIIISDDILSFLIDKSYINSYVQPIISNTFNKIDLKDIIYYYNTNQYNKIIKFIDLGMFGDLDILSENSNINKEDSRFYLDFYDFEPFSSFYITTINYLSPFAIFNFKKFIEINKFNIILTKKFIKISDFWTYNLIFIIIIYNCYDNYDRYTNSYELKAINFYYNQEKYKTYKYTKFNIFDINNNLIIIKEKILNVLMSNTFFISDAILKYIYTITNIIQSLLNCKTSNYFPIEFNLDFDNSQNILKLMAFFLE